MTRARRHRAEPDRRGDRSDLTRARQLARQGQAVHEPPTRCPPARAPGKPERGKGSTRPPPPVVLAGPKRATSAELATKLLGQQTLSAQPPVSGRPATAPVAAGHEATWPTGRPQTRC